MRKKLLIAGGVVLLLAVVGFTVANSRKDVAEVQVGKVVRQNLASVVSGSGEIRPQTYVNIGANSMGRITRLHVREGETVKKGQLLAELESAQSAADVAATRAALEAARKDALAAAAGLRTARADLNRAQADGQRAKLDFERAEGLFQDALISKAEYDMRRAAFESADAAIAQAQARIAQTQAQMESAQGRVAQAEATLARASDVLSKTLYHAPFDGIVTNLPVREGETVVMGIQNAPGSTLMTIADMSVITAEVKIDETDIVNVTLGQPAEITIDALPRRTFQGTVTEIGNNAVIRSTGISTATANITTQEAKDFKVVITLTEPPENLRPGLSTTAKITTATREDTLVIPIQALTVRERGELERQQQRGRGERVQAASPEARPAAAREELHGVFVVRDRKAEFVPIETGIAGITEIEVLKGLNEGDEIVTGSYRVLRSLKHGNPVKQERAARRTAS
jgi:HlyD family secretion protein